MSATLLRTFNQSIASLASYKEGKTGIPAQVTALQVPEVTSHVIRWSG
jgi:hypothetical protein